MKMLPSDLEAEKSVLSAMLIRDGESIADVQGMLSSDDFYSERHRLIYRAMLTIYNEQKSINLIVLREWLKRNDELEKSGGWRYISELGVFSPTNAYIKNHAELVKEKSQLRSLIAIGEEIADEAYAERDDARNIIDRAEQSIFSLTARSTGSSFEHAFEIVTRVYRNINGIYESGGKMTGLSTGIIDLDKYMGGLKNSDFIIIAARPSMGKTALAINIARNVARNKGSSKAVALFSLEMSKEQLGQRLLCLESELDSQKLNTGNLDESEWRQLQDATDHISKMSLYVDDTPALTAIEVRSRARRLKAEYGLDLVIIDYLQLMQGGSRRGEINRQQEISDISRSMKGLARELDIPVIALSQLSRAVEMRAEKKPQLSDLRESGSLEQDADVVLFLYRESYYNPEAENPRLTELILAKHRNGPTGTVNVNFKRETMTFSGLDTYHEQ